MAFTQHRRHSPKGVDKLVKPCYNTHMKTINPTLNPLEVLIVCDELKRKGVENYTLTEGNQCIWAYYGRINEYYIFRDGRLVDVQID